ncbi:MAG: hypothetical protein ACI4QV_01945 [Acutalibacteraceae bacterium]
MNTRIYNYIESLSKGAVQNEELRKKKEVLYDRMDRVFNAAVSAGKDEEAAFLEAVNSVCGAGAQQSNPYQGSYGGNAARVRPYSSSWIKAVAVAMLILSPPVTTAGLTVNQSGGFHVRLSGVWFLCVVAVAVGLLVFDAFRVKYPGIKKGVPVMLGSAVFLYISAFGFSDLLDDYVSSILSLPLFAVFIAGGVALDVIACKMIREYKDSNGEVVKKPKSNRFGWLVMLISCLLSSCILITATGVAAVKDTSRYLKENGISLDSILDDINDQGIIGIDPSGVIKGAGEVESYDSVRIAWTKGNITVGTHNKDTVYFCQTKNGEELSDGEGIGYVTDGEKLTIMQLNTEDSADCVIYLPEGMIEKVEFDVAGSHVSVTGVYAGELEINGTTEDFSFCGTADEIEVNDVSGSSLFDLDACPREFDYDTIGGSVKILLPADSFFKVSRDALGGSFSSDFASNKNSGNEFSFDSVGGSVEIVKKQY